MTRVSQEEWDSRVDAGEDPYRIDLDAASCPGGESQVERLQARVRELERYLDATNDARIAAVKNERDWQQRAQRLEDALRWIANRYRGDDDGEARAIARKALA